MYAWAVSEKELFNINTRVYLFITNSKKLKLGDKIYANKNGYIQKRKTENCMGLVLKTGKNLTFYEHYKLTDDLRKILIKKYDEKRIHKNDE